MTGPALTSERWSKKLWKRFVNHLRIKTPLGLVYLGGAVVLVGFLGVLNQQDTLFDNQRDSDRLNAYLLCLDSVNRSDNNRAQWEQLVDVIEALGGERAQGFADELAAGPLLSSEPRKAEDCIDPPVTVVTIPPEIGG